jgi:ABC-type multidrug transport system ATPase subunit
MKISLEHISKKFQHYWIFKEINYSFSQNGRYALLGANGSGKSTLLRIIAGMQSPSRGKLVYKNGEKEIEPGSIFPFISFAAPGMEIVEELTLKEFLDFHFNFKKIIPGLSINKIIETIGLQAVAEKQIGDYSSGMKQRVKLAQAIFSDTPVLLLDEPCTNLDQAGVDQYTSWINDYAANRLVIVASNDEREHYFCDEKIELGKYK